MARPRKEGKKVSFYMDAEIVERLDEYCEEMGQSKTLAVERIIKARLDEHDKEKQNKQ